MTTQEVADKFDQLAQSNQWDKIQDELYSEDAESIEPPNAAMSGLKNVKGREALKQKAKEFNEMVEEMYGGFCSKPETRVPSLTVMLMGSAAVNMHTKW